MAGTIFLNPLTFLYNEFLWRPLFNGLVWFYNIVPGRDLGLAIVALTVVIRVILIPLMWKARKAQEGLQKIQPEIKKVQEQHKNNKEAQGKALMELYQRHKVNPFSGCLIMLVQLPILIALFKVFRSVSDVSFLSFLYTFVENPGLIDPTGFGVIDLSRGNIYLGVLAALTQFIQAKISMPVPSMPQRKDDDFANMLQKQTLYLFPLFILISSYSLPAALTLYWTVLNIFGIVQDVIIRFRAQN